MASRRAARRREQMRECGNKNGLSREQAEKEAIFRTKHNDLGKKFDAYKCNYCGEWHIGHRSARIQRVINSKRKEEK